MKSRIPADMDPSRIRKWGALESLGDMKRALRWVFLSTKCGAIDTSVAYCLNTILGSMLKLNEQVDLAERLSALEASDQPTIQRFEVVDERILQ